MDLSGKFDEYESALLVSPAVVGFNVVKRRVMEQEGYIRVRVDIVGGGLFEFSEFWSGSPESDFALQEYSYHWQNKQGHLVKRWDSAKHYNDMIDAPHHIHLADGTVQSNPQSPTLQSTLNEIEGQTPPDEQKVE